MNNYLVYYKSNEPTKIKSFTFESAAEFYIESIIEKIMKNSSKTDFVNDSKIDVSVKCEKTNIIKDYTINYYIEYEIKEKKQ